MFTRPSHEGQYYSQIVESPLELVQHQTLLPAALRDRKLDSSYGATFYPWVQTRDENSGQLVWIPPSVAMMGVLASSERASQVWFAPAGFNRGGLV
jgi:phage tail sheath protein FI